MDDQGAVLLGGRVGIAATTTDSTTTTSWLGERRDDPEQVANEQDGRRRIDPPSQNFEEMLLHRGDVAGGELIARQLDEGGDAEQLLLGGCNVVLIPLGPVGVELGGDVQARHGGQLVRPRFDTFARSAGGGGGVDQVPIEAVHGSRHEFAVVPEVIDNAVRPIADLGAPLGEHRIIIIVRRDGGDVGLLGAEHGPELIFNRRRQAHVRRRPRRRVRVGRHHGAGTASAPRHVVELERRMRRGTRCAAFLLFLRPARDVPVISLG